MNNNIDNHSTRCYSDEVQILMTRTFAKWAKKKKLDHMLLYNAVVEAENDLIEVYLGNCLIKKRIKYGNKGKRVGIRTIIFFKKGSRSVFLQGFTKNEKDNITENEQIYFKKIVEAFLTMTDDEFGYAISKNKLIEVK